MRRHLSSLTLRGRAFVAAGATAVVCAVGFDQPALTRVGVLVLALPLLATFVVSRRKHDPTVARTVWPRLLRAGETARIDLTIASERKRSDGALLVEDTLPYALGGRARFVLQGLGGAWERTVSYPVRSDIRGRYVVGPVVARLADPFGLVERRRPIGGTAQLTVTPRVVPLPAVPLTGGWQGAGEHRPQAFASGSAEDVSVREYRRGDDLRRVHWRSSARIGELMVRREEQPWEAHATVLLDNRRLAHRGQGPASSLEAAVIAAASVAMHLEQHGYAVQLCTADGIGGGAAGDPTLGAERALEHLAVVEMAHRSTLDVTWSGEQARGGVVVAVLGGFLPEDNAALRRIRHDAGAALALVLDVDQWSPSRAGLGAAAVAPVTSLAWRATALGPRDHLDVAWRELGRAPVRGGARA
ncbi:DUF58 domain-containing protein [Nocardioides kongjuensis]|uniref:Uncharacterized protein (DUF58 family) n=1 Tax=Nocardioides kongjuensis TaxID=349522 RepID=A0A852RQM6_9ACTN|nr:DUF58 domain-containing protein [Nocardioides kongjuensis]NYD30244.1 uncharacterized protein (DUF58 family) [Nocardioides kongjuensis]